MILPLNKAHNNKGVGNTVASLIPGLVLMGIILAGISVRVSAQHLSAPVNVRAVWVRPLWGLSRSVRADERAGKAHIRAELETLQKAGFNTIYVESLFQGYSMYPSRLLSQRPLNFDCGAEWNVLQTYLDEGARLKLQIHAWAHIFFVWHTGQGAWQNSPLLAKHPDWVALDRSGSPLVEAEAEGANREFKKIFISPSNPQAREYLVAAIKELTVNYPKLAGVQFDYIRYPLHWPEAPFDYNPDALQRFKLETKLDATKLSAKATPVEWQKWQDWKTQQVTDTVKLLAEVIRTNNPKLIISAAVFPGFAENLKLKMQDSAAWAKLGYVDALLPMVYSRDFTKVEAWAREFRLVIPSQVRVYPALYVSHFYEASSKTLDMRYLEMPGKLKLDGYGLFAAQLITEDLAFRLKGL